ncbi:hypothetical protein HZF24_17425 [Sedimentibacter hydroxybenzoicus DSM 7310]|uniref:Uncharacterized protein n=2 Tax=Sedimentibacter hydroxybenzoicus TaxID=29345 RepID=A0A974BMK4_SEDHY|nr:hypothetical protein [Sedimentibacter hydroxybenzoicus DSM 7310]
MKKEEILAKSRKEKKDEGFIDAKRRGEKVGIGAFCVVFAFIAIFSFANGQPIHAPMAMFWAFLAAEAYPQYKFTQNKIYLVTVIAGTIACLASLGNVVMTTLR